MSKQVQKPLRLLLDSNVWRCFADAPATVAELARVTRKRSVRIQVAPAVVYEALRTRDHELRKRLVHTMARPQWTTVMPEAYSEAEEFIAAVKQLRPAWLRDRPDLAEREAHRRDWLPGKRTFWGRVQSDPDGMSRLITFLDQDILPQARRQARLNRKVSHSAGWTFDAADIDHFVARPAAPLAGWDGDDVPAWRVSAMLVASRSFLEQPHRDWIHPVMDLGDDPRTSPSWVRFWLYDVKEEMVLRFWLRGVIEELQTLRRVSDGTPCDCQLATYLFEADEFLTFDRAFADILAPCIARSPRPVAHATGLRLGKQGASEALEWISDLRRQRAERVRRTGLHNEPMQRTAFGRR